MHLAVVDGAALGRHFNHPLLLSLCLADQLDVFNYFQVIKAGD